MLRLFVFALLALVYSSNSFSQVATQLRTGTFVNTQPARNPSNNAEFFQPCLFQGNFYLWLQFNELPTEEEKIRLTTTGARIFDYMPKNTFMASFPLGYDFDQLASFNVYAVTRPLPYYKVDPSLTDPTSISWAVVNDSLRHVVVSFVPAFTKDEVAAALFATEATFTRQPDNESDGLRLLIDVSQLPRIAAHPLVQYIEPIGAPPVLEDEQGVSNHRNNMLFTSDNFANGRKLDGSSVVIAMGDDGAIGPHIDFTGRIEANASGTTAATNHGDHVAGIILGAGNMNPVVKGQAPGAILRAYNGYNDFSLFPTLYTTNLVRVTTHSLGQTCNAGYTTNARTSDQQLRTHASLMHVHSAGNSGTTTCGGLSGGWKTITGGYKAGKNVLAIANLTKSDVISSSSSKGPLPDGRIKPDVAAVGSSVNSTQADNGFTSMSGTSMAAPAVAGSLAVLYQAYKKANAGAEPNSGLIKAIMMNTADDLGTAGPDFTYGWGRVNGRRAVECIEACRFVTGAISQGGQNTHAIVIPQNVAAAKVMVYWVDKEATAGAAKSLVNDIDTWIVSPVPGVEAFAPWKLNPGPVHTTASCSAPATLGTDTLNNVEQVQINNPAEGTYQLKVAGTAIPQGPQTYYVVYEFLYKNNIVVVHPFGGESFVPNETQRIRWDASGITSNFTIAYSANEGATWNTIASGVGTSQRYYDWTVPNINTNKALIRVSSGSYHDNSDTNFTILPVPTGVSFSAVCAGTTKISWNAVSGATGYDVFTLGDKFMEKAASTAATNVTLTGLGSGLQWFAVRANMGTRGNGRRTNAVSNANTSTTACTMPVKLVSFTAIKKGEDAELTWMTAQESGIVKYVVERSASPLFENIITVGEVASRNSSVLREYRLQDKNVGRGNIWYYRLRIVEVDKEVYSNVQVLKWDKQAIDIVVYPSPASSSLFIRSNKIYTAAVAEIINENGAKVLTSLLPNTNTSIDVTKLSAGIYFIVITDPKEGVIARKQFTIAR